VADLEKSVAIIFEGVDQMGAGVTSATRQLDTLAGSVQQAAQPMADLTMGVLKFETALLAAGAAVTGLAIKTAGDFDTSFREITTLLDGQAESFDGLRGRILDYVSTSTQSLGTVTSAYYGLISAGNDTEEALTLLAAAEALAIGGVTELDTAAKALAGTLSAYGAEAGEAESYTDALFVAMQGGMTTIGELSTALPQITGLAAQLGVPFEEVAAAVAALTTTGLSTSQAVTQVGAALNATLGPSQQAKQLAEELGVEFNATGIRAQGLEGFLQGLAEATGGSEEAMRTLFGSSEATRGALGLTGPVADRFAEILGNMGERAGATATAVEKMADDVQQGTQKIKNAMTTTLVGIGLPILDEFSGIQEAIAGVFNAIGASIDDGQLKQFTALLESVFSDVEATLQEVAQNLPEALETADWSGFLNGIEAIRGAISEVFDGADLTTAEGLASVIAKLGTGFELLSEYTAGAITAIGPFIEKLADLAGWIMEIDPAWVAMMGKIGGAAVVLTTVLSVFSSFLGIVNNLAGAKGALPAMTSATGKLTAALGLTSSAGLWAAGLGAAYGIKQLYDQVQEFNQFKLTFSEELEEELEKTTGAQKAATEFSLFGVQKIAEAYGGLSDYFGWGEDAAADLSVVSEEAVAAAIEVTKAAESMGTEGEAAAKQLSAAAIDAALKVAGVGEAMDTTGGEAERAGRTFDEAFKQMVADAGEATTSWQKLGEGVYGARQDFEEVDRALESLRAGFRDGLVSEEVFRELESGLLAVKQGGDAGALSLSTMGGAADDAAGEFQEGAKRFEEFEKAAMELASNERIKAMEFTANIRVAEIEADAQKVEAIMNSLSTTIESTGQVLDGLYSDRYGNDDLSRWDQVSLDSAIRKEQEGREEALRLQNELTRTQIESMRARTEALRNGDGLIKIESDGLEPALEMIMWQILEKIQLRANAEATEFLVGWGGGQ